ncbi:MAG: TMEM175 family protein [Gemmatimonadaceae bacterium]
MNKGRLEAFSDGVLAIVITIMVLEMQAPHGAMWADLRPLLHVFGSYALSFVYVGIYWNNHHHLLQSVKHVNGRILWANLHLLFWLTLIPFVTRWVGDTKFAAAPVALYGMVLLCAAIGYTILVRALLSHPEHTELAIAIGSDVKGKISLALYAAAVLISFESPPLASAVYVAVAIIWLVPDKRIERRLAEHNP